MLETITIGLDGVLLVAATVTGVIAWRTLSGRVSTGITVACVGLVFLGFAHLSETMFGIWFNFVGEGAPEITHRVLVLGGFTFLCLGLAVVGGELRREMVALKQSNVSLEQAQEELRLSNEELRERNRQLLDARITAATDGLTGLQNHRTFHQDLRDAVETAAAARGRLAVVMLDVDGFKQINDTYGHLVGDEVLRQVAVSVQVVCRERQTYRYGGDEFAFILADADEDEARAVAERLRIAIISATAGTGREVTVSLGVAAFPDSAATAEQLVYGSDAAMYWAKSAGKNRVARWSELVGDRERLSAAARESQLLRIVA